jgi:hypothetical protein
VCDFSGTSKKNGEAYSICSMAVVVPFERATGSSFSKVGAGLELINLDTTKEVFNKLMNVRFPFKALLTLTPVRRGKDTKHQVTDFKPV